MSNLDKAREFCQQVGILAKKYNLPVFIVTDGASLTSNNGNECVRFHREKQIEWENKNGFDPNEDWARGFESSESNDVVIRKATNNDRRNIRNMTVDLDDYYCETIPSFKKHYTTKQRQQSYDFVNKLPISNFHIMSVNGKSIGTIAKWNNNGEWTLLNFWVDPKYRRKGYGTMLLKNAIQDINDEYCVLSVYKDNKPSVQFYKNFGFKHIRTEKDESGDSYWLRYDMK